MSRDAMKKIKRHLTVITRTLDNKNFTTEELLVLKRTWGALAKMTQDNIDSTESDHED